MVPTTYYETLNTLDEVLWALDGTQPVEAQAPSTDEAFEINLLGLSAKKRRKTVRRWFAQGYTFRVQVGQGEHPTFNEGGVLPPPVPLIVDDQVPEPGDSARIRAAIRARRGTDAYRWGGPEPEVFVRTLSIDYETPDGSATVAAYDELTDIMEAHGCKVISSHDAPSTKYPVPKHFEPGMRVRYSTDDWDNTVKCFVAAEPIEIRGRKFWPVISAFKHETSFEAALAQSFHTPFLAAEDELEPY